MTFTARLTLLFGFLWALLLALGLAAVYWGLGQGLEQRVEALLVEDARRIAALYASGESGTVPGTGGVEIALYDFSGLPVYLPEPRHRIPQEVLAAADQTVRVYRGEAFRAAFVTSPLGVLAVTQDTAFIAELSAQVAQTLALIFVLALPLGLVAVRLAAVWATRPLAEAATGITRRDPLDLSPIPYQGPDDELGRIVNRFNALLADLRAARERERVFLTEVSHELRTPLTALTGYLERLAKNPRELEALEGARRTARHLTRLVEDLLALARGEAERTVNPHIVDLREVLRAVVGEYPGVRLELPRTALEVLGDPDRLEQLVRNLLSNAVRAAGRPEGVCVQAGRDGEEVWFTVRDSGPGIPPELLPRLFERFARGPGGGTGLGLAIARQITEAHEGTIRVASKPGETVFTVRLPALAEED